MDIGDAARKILLRARQRADQVLAEAQKEADLLKEREKAQGYADGHAEGLKVGTQLGSEAGHAKALAENAAALTQLVKTLSDALSQLDDTRDDLQTKGINQVVELACAIAKRVTKRQGIRDPKVLEENIKEAMGLVVHAVDIRIAVHPSQFRTMQHELPRLKLAWPKLKHIEIIQDTALSPGGVRIFTAGGQIDGDLDAKLDVVIAEVMADDPSAPEAAK
jgi:flagellar assembly protein FliH